MNLTLLFLLCLTLINFSQAKIDWDQNHHEAMADYTYTNDTTGEIQYQIVDGDVIWINEDYIRRV